MAGRETVVSNEKLLIITGSYGSGKTEFAVNLAVEKNKDKESEIPLSSENAIEKK